jgi:antitoxin ParD1/3/4
MAQMNISLPETLKEWVDAQVATGRFAGISDYMGALIREHMDQQTRRERLNQLLEDGYTSSLSDLTVEETWTRALARSRRDA